jgi:hypothetical protein
VAKHSMRCELCNEIFQEPFADSKSASLIKFTCRESVGHLFPTMRRNEMLSLNQIQATFVSYRSVMKQIHFLSVKNLIICFHVTLSRTHTGLDDSELSKRRCQDDGVLHF